MASLTRLVRALSAEPCVPGVWAGCVARSPFISSCDSVKSNGAQTAAPPSSIRTILRFQSQFTRGVRMTDSEHPGTMMTSSRESEKEFLSKVFDLILKEGVEKQLNGDCKVVNFKHPEELLKTFDFKLQDDPETTERLLELCQDTYDYSVKTGHPQFFNTNFNGQDTFGLAGAMISDSLNTSQYTFDNAPVFTLMEHEVLGKIRDLCGFESGDGILTPGGTLANLFAVNLARYRINPDFRKQGIYGSKPMKIFVSDQSHYSFVKGAVFMGIGTDNLVVIPTDDRGKMIPEKLEEAIILVKEQGHIPLMVAATCGSTVLASYDPLEPIADICERHGDIWLHVDAAWGGGAMMTRKYRHLLKGIHRVKSLTWCLHKMMGVPFQCTSFVVNGNKDLMTKCHAANAEYLFQPDKFYDVSYDTGDKTLQCGRRVDIFKLWLMWKAKGNKGFDAETTHKFDMARSLADLIKNTEGFQLVQEPECTNVCFWYIPECLRGQEQNADYFKRLSKVAPQVKEAMTLEGTMLLTFQPNEVKSHVNFFKVGIGSARVKDENLAFILEEIQRLGKDIKV
eukprot:XP_791030.3 PREDICTED: cysteine sulfinic acid decarboxylase [Strongylocentrotus purpuratus]